MCSKQKSRAHFQSRLGQPTMSCSSFLPKDLAQASEIIMAILRMALKNQYPVVTAHRETRVVKLQEIVSNTTAQMEKFQKTGVLDAGDGEAFGFAEMGVSSPEGSTVDIYVQIIHSAMLVLRVHHGRGNAVTYHLPGVKAEFTELVYLEDLTSRRASCLLCCVLTSFRSRFRVHQHAVQTLNEGMRLACQEEGKGKVAPQGMAKPSEPEAKLNNYRQTRKSQQQHEGWT
jgi:hypothetical protein